MLQTDVHSSIYLLIDIPNYLCSFIIYFICLMDWTVVLKQIPFSIAPNSTGILRDLISKYLYKLVCIQIAFDDMNPSNASGRESGPNRNLRMTSGSMDHVLIKVCRIFWA